MLKGEIATIRCAPVILTRTEMKIAYHKTLTFEVLVAFKYIGEDENVRVVVLSAKGEKFSAGGDLNRMSRMAQNCHQAVTVNNYLITLVSHKCINYLVTYDTARWIAVIRATDECREVVLLFGEKREPLWVRR